MKLKEKPCCKSVCGIAAALSLTLAVSTRADLLVYEPFDYPIGPVSGDNGGTGFSGPWTMSGTITVDSGSLGVPGYQGIGNDLQLSISQNTIDASRPLSISFGGPGKDIWVSCLSNPISVGQLGETFLGFGSANGATGVGVLRAGQLGQGTTSPFWGALATYSSVPGIFYPHQVFSSIPVAYGQTTLLVEHFTYQNGLEQLDLYVNPGSAMPQASDITATFPAENWNTISLWVGSGNALYDELRMGTTYADVVPSPEPSTLAFLTLPLLTLLGRNRRKNQRIKL